jgi:hypothetical protein
MVDGNNIERCFYPTLGGCRRLNSAIPDIIDELDI